MIFWIGYAFKFFLTFFETVLAVSQKCQDAKVIKIIDFEEWFQ
jgi:hypothetical protein